MKHCPEKRLQAGSASCPAALGTSWCWALPMWYSETPERLNYLKIYGPTVRCTNNGCPLSATAVHSTDSPSSRIETWVGMSSNVCCPAHRRIRLGTLPGLWLD